MRKAAGRLGRQTALACLFALGLCSLPASAQDLTQYGESVPSDSQMLLESDVLTYDQDNNTVSASGQVRIEYGGNRLVAERVTYDRKTGRLKAIGNVEVIEKDGNRIFTDEIDVTDDFADGFVNALRVETVDKTYFAAESADRKGGNVTTFNNGVYTACEPCEEKPDKAPIWRVKSRKIIWNGQKKTIRFERSQFEMFGLPIAYLPAFEVPDPTVKRKTGFLFPGITYSSKVGAGLTVPFYIALAPTYDLTLKGTGYTKQGFLGEAEWRQRFNSGEYNLKIAGIDQADPEAFESYSVDRGTPDDPNELRGMVGSKGRFEINPRWTFGWDLLLQSDKNFSRTYNIEGFNSYIHRSEVYLTGLGERNYFDMRFMKFQVQEKLRDDSSSSRNDKQPWVLPSFDYVNIADEPVAGGELKLTLNSRVINRSRLDYVTDSDLPDDADVTAVRGVEGTDGRMTAETEWKREFVTPGGLVITPLLSLLGEARMADQSVDSIGAIGNMANQLGVDADVRSEYYRYMATAGLDVRWPVLFSTTSSTHILEPVAQLFVRPDEQHVSELGLSNEDSQSFVFDATSLFDRNKFSGFDRIEGGTRANLGLRYSGTYNNGWSTNAVFGQSYHLGGLNSFVAPDLVNVGAESGLETDTSDYVGLVGFSSPFGLSASLSGRFDEKTFETRRAEARAAFTGMPVSLTAKYAYIQAQPIYGFANDRHEVTLGGSVKLHDYWRVFGSGTYDIKSDYLSYNSFGFGYADECFTFALTYSESRTLIGDTRQTDNTQNIGFQLSFRTIGDFGNDSKNFLQ
ncbi:MAG: LPS-assembly protein LptD [Rhizobiaceae bacterium]|nr:LPS-assembly protein LptD [Rhizobiaceae bacterium]